MATTQTVKGQSDSFEWGILWGGVSGHVAKPLEGEGSREYAAFTPGIRGVVKPASFPSVEIDLVASVLSWRASSFTRECLEERLQDPDCPSDHAVKRSRNYYQLGLRVNPELRRFGPVALSLPVGAVAQVERYAVRNSGPEADAHQTDYTLRIGPTAGLQASFPLNGSPEQTSGPRLALSLSASGLFDERSLNPASQADLFLALLF